MSIFLKFIFFREKLRHTHTAFFKGEIFHYEITQHSHTISRSLVLCLRFISRTISANTSLTFVRCLALASTKEQPHIWAKAWKKKKENILTHIIIIHFILGVRFTDTTLWRKSAIKEVNDWVHYISFFPKKVLLMYIGFSSSPQVCLQYVKLCSKGS